MNREYKNNEITNKLLKLTIAHVNDTHSYFEPTSLQLTLKQGEQILRPYVSAGGFARIATRIHQLRSDAQRMRRGFLFLHAGDCFQGTLYFSLFKGTANADMLNELQLDAMVLGNHELDMGNAPVAAFVRKINFPFLAGNWDLSKEDLTKHNTLSTESNVLSYVPSTQSAQWLCKWVGDEPVAIFGVSIDKMAAIANPDLDTPFANAIETVKNTISDIRSNGINKIILLSHLGYEEDKQLASQVSGLSLIIGGHSHTLQGDFSSIGLGKQDHYGVVVNDIRIVQSGCNALSLGHCDIEFDAQGRVISFSGRNELLLGRRLFLNASMDQVGDDDAHIAACDFLGRHPNVVVCKKDPQVQSMLLDKYVPRVRALQKKVIANVDRNLRHVRLPDEKGGSEIAPLVAHSFYYMLNKNGQSVEFVIHNAGGVRTSLNAGELSVADVAGKLLPFAVPVGCYRVTGEVIALIIEGAINNATNNGVNGTGTGSYPYTYNLKYRYMAENLLGSRVEELQIFTPELGWQPVEKTKIYTGSSSAYSMKGKEGYQAILQMQGEGFVSQYSMADCFTELLTDHPEVISHFDANQSLKRHWHKGC
ncbi:bifunctional metallophosphatase/5'-nucleotidase [Vibrio sp. S4M6]|uniref:bifunctional metallophosphatase/5'-nucleotidase n=1 Tax=Vibrio sinus TaxID=2946865 RepID=UPI00202AB4F2|nr:bifunctional UDP-sugar hydrolase/5'-nucleotidase [Vibrio sinus]MCL9783218.1 bifunctional metallophosphatase/5'-nucleotidase [Vibrio sinus]